jgi:hypothetical protein
VGDRLVHLGVTDRIFLVVDHPLVPAAQDRRQQDRPAGHREAQGQLGARRGGGVGLGVDLERLAAGVGPPPVGFAVRDVHDGTPR